MSRQTNNLSNLPDYYFKLNTKQQRNWRKNTRKYERNEEQRAQNPPYHPAANINIIHIHHQTEINTIEQLIHQARETVRYTIDIECQKGQVRNHGALVQIEMVHSNSHSTMILLETYQLPDVDSLLADKIKQLWSIIFNSGNEIITWGPIEDEFKNFQHLKWMKIGKIKDVNLQSRFQDQQNGIITHPARERRVLITGVSLDTPGVVDDDDDDDDDDYKL